MIEIKEPFPEWAWPKAWAWATSNRRSFDDFFPPDLARFVEEYSVRFARARTFGLWKDSSLDGIVILEPNSPTVATAHILVARRLWGLPAAELRKVAGVAFERDPWLRRIQAFVPASNRLAIALSKRIGGTAEGTLRKAIMRNGRMEDAIVFGLTREEFYGRESRGSVRTDQLEGDLDLGRSEHLRSGTDGGTVGPRDEALVGSGGVDRGHADAGSSGAEERGGGRDQQNEQRDARPDKPVLRKPRIRKKRNSGKSGARNGTRKGSGARSK
jgi:RimJ/RimL family protein N-acetyltransferase